MRGVFSAVLLGWALLIFGGCSQVLCEKPFGTPLPKSELKQFEGEWLFENVIAVKLGKDHLVAAVLQFDEERDEFKASNVALHLTRQGDAQFLFVQEPLKNHCSMYLVQEATPTKITCRVADVKKFNALLDEGQVKGKRLAESTDPKNPPSVLLDLSDESFTALLKHATLTELFPPANTFAIEKRIPPTRK